jgi:hypothetical protein
MTTRKQIAITLIAALAMLAIEGSAFAGDFVSYEGKDSVQEGTGGEKKVVDGVDFWSNGAPPRKFKLLGFVTDSRLKSGLIGKMRMSGLESSIAREAKKAGGDAVILSGSESETKSYVGQTQTTGRATATSYGNTTNAWGRSNSTSQAAAVQTQHTRYAVVKYLADDANDAKK